MNVLLTLATIAVGLEALVLFHLLGHLLVAKILRVPVELRLGFGPALPGCRFSSGRDACVIAWFPLGGYVTLPMPDSVTGEAPHIWRRLVVCGGGVAGNILLAWLCFAAWLYHGAPCAARIPCDV